MLRIMARQKASTSAKSFTSQPSGMEGTEDEVQAAMEEDDEEEEA